jgi:hypothetical protein
VVHHEPRHLNEVYYPGVDQACTRDLGLIVANGKGYFFEEKRPASLKIFHLIQESGLPSDQDREATTIPDREGCSDRFPPKRSVAENPISAGA